MIEISRSQRGARATWEGLDYQKKYIAYLAIKLLSKDNNVQRIICENLEDIEVEEHSKIVYYQVKSTSSNTLSSHEIADSIKLFLQIEAEKRGTKAREYVLVSNAKIGTFDDYNVRHQYEELDDMIKQRVNDLKGINDQDSFLEKVYLQRGPELQEASSVLTNMIIKSMKDENFGFDVLEGIKNDLLSHINSMCTGPINLEDKETVYSHESEQASQKYKVIDAEILKKIVDSNQPQFTGENRRTIVSSTMTFSYKIMPTKLTYETKQEMHELLNEYSALEDHDLRITYLQKFNEYSTRYDLYKDSEFLDFLEDQIKNGSDKHIILECLFILHRLIITSKVDDEKAFLEYVRDEYFSFFEDNLKTGTERYEYSLFKIEQILEEIKNLISEQQICEMY
jgi:hypothetical protein